MAEYIEREAAIKIAESYGLANGFALGRHSGVADAIAVQIASIPAADVAPVVHGYWVYKSEYGQLITRECSRCLQALTQLKGEAKKMYCPECGAKMYLQVEQKEEAQNNREILFRGQNRKNGEKVSIGSSEKLPGHWVYGGIYPGEGDFSIIYGCESAEEQTACNIKKWTVYSDTVGQYTGLTDKNGVKIFEGDIVRYIDPDTQEYDIGKKYVAGWDEEEACILFECFVYGESISYEVFNKKQAKNLEVIGNIFDNSELLKEASNGQTNHP